MASTLEQAERGIAHPPAADLPVVKGIPVRAGPGIIGARVSHLQPPPVAVPATLLDMDEQAGYISISRKLTEGNGFSGTAS